MPDDLKFKDDHVDLYLKETGPSKNQDPDSSLDSKFRNGERKTFYYVRQAIWWILALCTLAIIITFVLHLVLPSSLRWLTHDELNDIKNFALTVTAGLLMSIGTNIVSKK